LQSAVCLRYADVPSFHTHKPDDEAYVKDRLAEQTPEVGEETPAESPECVRKEALALVRSILGEIMANENARLALDCYALVTGVGYMGETMTTIAKRHGLSRAAVSKRCVTICNALNLPPPPAMRKLTARRAYGKRAKKHHAGSGH